MNEFTYFYPVKNYFGEAVAKKCLPSELAKRGKTVLLAYGGGSIKKNGIYDEMISILEEAGKTIVEFPGIMPNPTYEKVQEGAKICKEQGVEFILAVGGGSVIDCCKIVSAQAKIDRDIWKMEFEDKQMPEEFIPMGAVVTASGTGAEQNCGAVITNGERKIKAGVWGAFADFAVLDPAYTLSVPLSQVISGAFDTLSHAMETYFGKPQELSISDEISEAVMQNTIFNIREMIKNPEDLRARSELMWDSAMAENGILKLGKVTDFQAHQLEHQLGAYTDCNHGQGLAVIHPVLYRHIYREQIPKFKRFATEIWNVETAGNSDDEIALAGIEALADFIREIGLPSTLTEMGIADKEILKAVADTCNVTAGCCKKLSREELFEILSECV